MPIDTPQSDADETSVLDEGIDDATMALIVEELRAASVIVTEIRNVVQSTNAGIDRAIEQMGEHERRADALLAMIDTVHPGGAHDDIPLPPGSRDH